MKKTVQSSGFVLVDTDGDRMPDTYLPGTSRGFFAGVGSQGEVVESCHADSGKMHCFDQPIGY